MNKETHKQGNMHIYERDGGTKGKCWWLMHQKKRGMGKKELYGSETPTKFAARYKDYLDQTAPVQM